MQTLMQPLQIVADSAQQLYLQALEAVQDGEEVASVSDANSVGSAWGTRERPTKELRHISLVLTNPRNRLISAPLVNLEKLIPRAILMTLLDEKDVKTLAFYDSKAWEFTDDGKEVTTNYGYRIRNYEEIDQIEQVISLFKKDKTTRRAVIHVHAPYDSEKRYNPCIDSLHFLIRNGQLECHSHWRSENALTLLPVNLFEFTLLQELIASELGISPGIYVHTVSSLHYYLEDEQKLRNTIVTAQEYDCILPMEPMPKNSLQQLTWLQEYEKRWRLNPSCAGEYDAKRRLSEFWKKMADTIALVIAKRTEQRAATSTPASFLSNGLLCRLSP